MKKFLFVASLLLSISIATFAQAPLQEVREDENPIGVTRSYKVRLQQNTAFTIKTLPINSGEAGVIMVFAAAVDASGNGGTGAKIVRYRKTAAGVLTLGTVSTVLALQGDTGMTGATFNMTANANNDIDITVTGPTSVKEIGWRVTVNPGVAISLAELQ